MKQNFHHTKFTVGEYSAAGLARVDIDKTGFAAEVQENILPSIIGKGQVRPGTEYLAETNSRNQARLIPFVRDIEDSALLELSPGKLRVMYADAFISRADVATTITNGDFSSGSGWTLVASSGASSTVTGGKLVMHANGRGSSASAEQMITVATDDLNKEHGIRIVIDRGPVRFRIGTASGLQDAVAEQILYTGTHSFSITPTSGFGTSYYLNFSTRFERTCIVDSIEIEPAGIIELDAPWAESELREIAFDQQSDIIVLTHENWQPRQIERRGIRSWSLILFEADGGPVERLYNGTRLKLSGNRNNVTLNSDEDFFTSGMVGGIVRIFHDSMSANYLLAGEDEWTETFRVAGIKGVRANDRKFSYSIVGTWSGTINIQRSISGEGGDYLDFNRDESTTASNITSNLSNTHLGNEEDNNVLGYHRIGFKEGNYTSGAAQITIIYQGQSGYGWGRITNYYGPKSVALEVIDPFYNTNWTTAWDIGSWGTFVPWPTSVCFHDNRLFLAGRDKTWASKVNNFNDFNDLDITDLATFTRTLGSGGNSSSAKWMLPLQRLIVGTEGSSVSIRSGEFDDTLTLNNVTMRDCATVGANYVSPLKLDARGVFVHQSGSDVYVLKPGSADYEADRLTVYNEDICKAGIVELSAQREPDTLVWCVRTDGVVPVLLYEHEGNNELKCWNKFITAGEVESVCVLPGTLEDRVYMVVNRTIADDIAPETVAEELAPNTGDAFAIGFTDQSIYVADSGTPANDRNEDGRVSPYGVELGPDAYFITTGTPKLTRNSVGLLNYQPHNLAPSSYDWTLSGFTLYNMVVASSPSDLLLAPDGTYSMQSLVPTPINAPHYAEFELTNVSAGSGSTRAEVEISFYTDGSFSYPSIEVAPLGSDQLGSDYAKLTWSVYDEDFPTHCKQAGTSFEVVNHDPNTWGPSIADGNPYAWQDVSTPELPNLRYVKVRFFVDGSNPVGIKFGANASLSSTIGFKYTGNGLSKRPFWGLNVNLTPVPSSALGGNPDLVMHAENAPVVLLPYQWDAAGECEGVRVEIAGQNRLSSGENFSTSEWVAENVDVDFSGLDSAPTGRYTASRLVETGSVAGRHGISHPVLGSNGQYVASLFVKTSSVGWVGVRLSDAFNTSYLVTFNTTTGAAILESNMGLANAEAGVEVYGFNTYRVWITAEMDPTLPAILSASSSSTASWASLPQPAFTSNGTSTATWGAQDSTPTSAMSASGTATAAFVDISTYPLEPLFTNLSFDDNPPFSSGGASSSHLPVPGWETDETVAVTLYGDISNGLRSIYGRDWISGYSGYSEFWQTGNLILAGVTAADIDAGNVEFSLVGWFGRSTTSTSYDCAVKVDYLDAADAIVSTPLDTGTFLPAVADVWETKSISRMTIPATTRKIKIWFKVYQSFAGCAGFKYELITNSNPADISLFENPSFEEGTTWLRTANSGQQQTTPPDYWTLDSGNMFTVGSDNIGIAPHDDPQNGGYKFIQGGVGSTQVSQTVDLLSRYTGMVTGADIDAGLMLVDFSIWQANTFASDTGRAHLEALDSGLSVISTLYDSGTNEITPLNTWQEFASSEILVPANTRYIRLTLNMNLVAGTVANALFDDITATLYFAPTNELYAAGAATASFVSIPPGVIEPAGAAVVTFDASADVITTWASTGSSSASFVNNDAVMTASASSTTSWDVSNIPIVSTATLPGSTGFTFSNAYVAVSTWSSAGAATTAFGSDVQSLGATMSIFLVDAEDPVLDSTNAPVYVQTDQNLLIVWGAQLEFGRNRPSTYMKVESSATRVADSITGLVSGIPWDDSQVTLFSEFSRLIIDAGEVLTVVNGTNSHAHELDGTAQSLYRVIDAAVEQAAITDGVLAESTLLRLASSAAANDARLVVDSGAEITDTSLTMPTVTGGEVRIGDGIDGIISRIMILPQTSTEAELQAMGVEVLPNTLRYIEKLCLRSEAIGGTINKMADSGVYVAGPVSSVTCSWLAERTDLVAWATNASGVVTPLTGLSADVSGVIALGGTYTDIWIGIGYRARYKSAKLAHANRGGSALTMPKKIDALGLLLADAHRDSVKFGQDFARLRQANLISRGKKQPDGTVNTTFDDQSFSIPGHWDTDSRLCLEVNAPYPCTFLGLIISENMNERGLGTR